MATSIDLLVFSVTTVHKGFEISAEVYCDHGWDLEEDQLRVNHMRINAHNCGTEFCKAFGNEYDIAEAFQICDADVEFVIRSFEQPDIEELVLDFVRAFLLGTAPFALQFGWWCSADRARCIRL